MVGVYKLQACCFLSCFGVIPRCDMIKALISEYLYSLLGVLFLSLGQSVKLNHCGFS